MSHEAIARLEAIHHELQQKTREVIQPLTSKSAGLSREAVKFHQKYGANLGAAAADWNRLFSYVLSEQEISELDAHGITQTQVSELKELTVQVKRYVETLKKQIAGVCPAPAEDMEIRMAAQEKALQKQEIVGEIRNEMLHDALEQLEENNVRIAGIVASALK